MTPSNTGSRNGIITWAVVATILGLGSLIWAIVSFTQASKSQKDAQALQDKYALIGSPVSDSASALGAVRESRNYGARTPLLDVAVRQNGELTHLIAGADATSDKKATEVATAAMTAAKTAAGKGGAIDTSSLVSTITGLSNTVTNLQTQVDQLNTQLASANARATAAEQSKSQVIAASEQKVTDATNTFVTDQKAVEEYRKTTQEALQGATSDLTKANSQAVAGTRGLNTRIAELQQQMAVLARENSDLKAQLAAYRVPTNQIVQQADGTISRVASTDTVYIDLGQGDQIAAGMTFEVYDKTGVPTVTSQEPAADQLLKGKASIEVIKVGQGTSECRVARLSPGATLTEGDPIVNVVYDKHVKFNFVVYGKFNLDNRGDATDEDANVIKRLISRWGAQVSDTLDNKTDFLVLGEEPVVPAYTQDELSREPEKAFQKEQAEQALTKYQDLRQKANQLNIPILNQNRFLYMIGYYEEASR